MYNIPLGDTTNEEGVNLVIPEKVLEIEKNRTSMLNIRRKMYDKTSVPKIIGN
jgi:hypothetical protein